MGKSSGIGTILAGVLLSLPAGGSAQAFQPTQASGREWQMGFSRALLDGPLFGYSVSVVTVRLSLPMGPSSAAFADAGASYGSSSWGMANLRVGAAFGGATGTSAFFALTLPVARTLTESDFASALTPYADIERPESSLLDTWAVEASMASRRPVGDRGNVGIRFGSAVIGSTERGVDPEAYSRYGVFADIVLGSARYGLELSGSAILSESNLGFSQRTLHQITISQGRPESDAAPLLFIRLPLDPEFREILNGVVGLRFRI